MLDLGKLLTIIIQAGALISAFAAIVAAVIMSRVTKKFGTGILASGFKSISFGVFFIALGILVDAVETYLQSANFAPIEQFITVIILIKLLLFVIGTYVIVIGSKKTGDKLESLTQ
ncbi:MAG: hypothetical protein AAB702_00030 [Patescibacteria group bacterium]